MHTVDASSDPSVSLVELPASNLRGCRDSVAGDNAQTTSSQFGNRTIAFDQTLHPSGSNQRTHSGTGVPDAASRQVPSWKRILDVVCIIVTMPLWLPVMIFLAVWVKLASPGPIFFRQERIGYRGN